MFITSIQYRLAGTPDNIETGKKYTKKEWVKDVSNHFDKTLVIETNDDHIILVVFDNENDSINEIVEIKNKDSNNVAKIVLSAQEKVLIGGNVPDSIQINPYIYPEDAKNKELRWESSNQSIATVDENGLVTAGDEKGKVVITAYSTDGSNQSSNIELEVNKCRQYFIKDGDIKESPIYGTPFAVYEGYYRDHLYTTSSPYKCPLHCLLFGTESEWEDVNSKLYMRKENNTLHIHSDLIGYANGYGLALEKIEKELTGKVELEYTMETNSWLDNWAFGVNRVKKIASFPEGLICKYGDGNVLYQRVNTIDTTIANRSSYSYETTITNSDQPIITICASKRGFSGVYISKYYFEY